MASSVNGEAVARDMADHLPPSMTGEATAASLVNGSNGQSAAGQEQDGQTISAEDAARKLQDNENHGSTCVGFQASGPEALLLADTWLA